MSSKKSLDAKKRMLICGGAGFIGYNMAKYFSKMYNVYVTTHVTPMKQPLDNITNIKCDLLNLKSIETLLSVIEPHIVIHAAATTSNVVDVVSHPYYHVTDNAVMTSLLFRQLHNTNVEHVIFLSCSVMYKSSQYPQKESDWKHEDLNKLYFGGGATKIYIEQLCDFYSRIGKVKYTAIRHPDVYGPYDKTNLNQCHMYSALFNKIMESDDSLDVWGTPETKRDLLYVEDLANFIDKCIKRQPQQYRLYNCGTEMLRSIEDIINIIMRVTHKKLKINFQTDKPNVQRKVLLDCERAYTELNWESRTSLTVGTEQVLKWYKNKC